MNMGDIRILELNAHVQGHSAVAHDCVILDVGNPQCAIFVDDFNFDWRFRAALLLSPDPRYFRNRTNVSFIRQVDGHTIDVRFWERGAGETNSSGTGSTGAAKAAVAQGLRRESRDGSDPSRASSPCASRMGLFLPAPPSI